MKCLGKASSVVVGTMETFFNWWGSFVAERPAQVILASLALSALSAIGLLNFKMEHKANMLWIPPDSTYNINQDWLNANFKKTERRELVIIKSENVLTPTSLQKMMELHNALLDIEVDGKRFEDICTRVPVSDPFLRRRKRDAEARLLHSEIILGENINNGVENPENRDQQGSGNVGGNREKQGSGRVGGNRELESESSDGEEKEQLRGEREINESEESEKTSDANVDVEAKEEEEEEEDYDDIWDDYEYDEETEAQVTKRPTVDFASFSRQNNLTSGSALPQDIQCSLVTSLEERCAAFSLLEGWKLDPDLVAFASQEEILMAINSLQRSPVYGHDTDFTALLGGIVRNTTGHIVAASTARMMWSISVPEDAVIVESQGSGVELELGDSTSLKWEEQFVLTAQRLSTGQVEVLPNAVKSYGAISEKAIFFDGSLMAGGYGLMFVYTVVMLGRLNWLECRLWLAVAGITSILLGLLVALGLASAMSLPYTPMHAILPFLCLGIGIDDMFVIMQCLNNIKAKGKLEQGVTQMIGATLRHAGVSLTVTSVTDVAAFAIGAVTLMPGLQSFCVSTALGLAAIYLLQISWFTAWLSLDEARIQAGRNSIVPCISVSKSEEVKSETRRWVRTILSTLLPSSIYKMVVLFVTLAILSFGAWGVTGMRQRFDPFLLIPQDSYLAEFIQVNDEYYSPYSGWSADVYTGPFNSKDLPALDGMVQKLQSMVDQPGDLVSVTSWWSEFKAWLGNKDRDWTEMSPTNFSSDLANFLHSVRGARFARDFRFGGELDCQRDAPPVLASRFSIEYRQFEGPEEHVPARRAVEKVLNQSGLSTAFSFVKIYAAWETDEIIGEELWRNVLLAMACVTAVVLLLLANFRICILVILAIILTLTDIIGFLHFWGITIDIISCINIVLAIGLCVDYSVHICHAFLVAKGSKSERAVSAVEAIGPAVLNGGVTTFLALVLLSGSTSHTFLTFFKVFVLTVVFGLFHGLVLLPVLLSLVGPEMELGPEQEVESRSESESSGVSEVSVEEGKTNHAYQEEKAGGALPAVGWYHKANNCFPKRGSWSPQGHKPSS